MVDGEGGLGSSGCVAMERFFFITTTTALYVFCPVLVGLRHGEFLLDSHSSIRRRKKTIKRNTSMLLKKQQEQVWSPDQRTIP